MNYRYPLVEAIEYADDLGNWWAVQLVLTDDGDDYFRLADSLTLEQASELVRRIGDALGLFWVLCLKRA